MRHDENKYYYSWNTTMTHLKFSKNQSIKYKNSEACVDSKSPINDRDINFLIAKISARYRETGLVISTICIEIAYQNGC